MKRSSPDQPPVGGAGGTGIRRVLCEERLSVIPIHDRRTGQPYRYVKGDGNFCYEIFRKPDGRWDGEVISAYEANQRRKCALAGTTSTTASAHARA